MPAYNREDYIGEAIESVLAQGGVDFQLVVVDDGSEDGTADIVRSFGDQRITLLQNSRRRGIGYSHNRILKETDSPFITHLDSDDFALPGALRTILDVLERRPSAGQAYCNFQLVDEEGKVAPAEARRHRRRLSRVRPPDDHGRALLVHGMTVSGLRTYRREVFEQVGGFDEQLPYAVDYEMAVRIAEHFEFAFVPDFLSCQRRHGENTSESLRFRKLRHWWMRTTICHRLLVERGGRLLGRSPLEVYTLLLLGLLHLTGLPGRLKRFLRPSP